MQPPLSTREAAQALGISGKTLKKLVRARLIPCCKPSPRCFRFRVEDLETYMASHTTKTIR